MIHGHIHTSAGTMTRTPDDGRLAVAPQRVFEEERELGVAVVDELLGCRLVGQLVDHVGQGQK